MSRPKKELKLRTWDIETTNWNEFKIACVYDGENKYFCKTPLEVVKVMIKLKGTFYAHFGGGFDNLFLLDTLKHFKLRIQNIKGRLVKISVYYMNSKKKLFELRDSYPILPSSLARLQKDFEVPICIDVKKWESYKKRRNDIHLFTEEELQEYVMVDTVVLYDILKLALKLFEVDDFKITIASESKSKFKEMYNEKEFWLPSRMDEYFRQSYSGGRVEVFKRHGKNLKHYDFKSMYPKVMDFYAYPSGVAIYTATFRTGKLGIYTCRITAPKNMKFPFLHAYNEKGKLLFPIGTWEATYTSIEIEKALELGYKIDILMGYYFTKTCRPFKEYIKKYYGMKQKAEEEKKPALRYIAKLYLNSLYGKFGQRRSFNKVVPIQGSLKYMLKKYDVKEVMKDLKMCVVGEESKAPQTTVHVASFVTAYARLELYKAFELVLSKGGEIYYCDTDCVITDIELPTAKYLGALDIEAEIEEAYFLFPKFYAYKMTNGKELIRTKGMSADFKFSDFKLAYESNKFDMFKDVQEGIIGLLEGQRRHQHHLNVLKRTRTLGGVFTKRILDSDGDNTQPMELIR